MYIHMYFSDPPLIHTRQKGKGQSQIYKKIEERCKGRLNERKMASIPWAVIVLLICLSQGHTGELLYMSFGILLAW